jgi:large subunit ribosomal protein L13
MKYTLDAQNKKVGRVATEAAVFLMGKNNPDYARNKIPQVTVEIKNASKASIEDKKKEQKTFARYSGYPGGLRKPNMVSVISKKGYSEVFKEAVWGMLPKNKLREKMMLNLVITE